jgi:hypothetical protein
MSSHDVPHELLARQLREACSELERQVRAGSGRRVEDLLAAYPALGSDKEAALELIYTEFVIREQLGQKVSPADWYARFPEWQRDLEQLFEVHRAVHPGQAADHTITRVSPPDAAGPRAQTIGPGFPIGNYELLDEIGRGGMGVVYRARQKGLDRAVALKLILAGAYCQPDVRARFRTEAEAAARLQHPNIVQIHEVGEQDGLPYMSLEFVDGGSLADHLDGTAFPSRKAAELIQTLAKAMDYAHQRGVVHRDLKPANILLQNPNHKDHEEHKEKIEKGVGGLTASSSWCSLWFTSCIPKITDFGLAKLLDQDKGHTQSGAIVGTPRYMAPEQAQSKSTEIGPLADVYALGAILYELIAGRPAFQGTNPLDILRQVVGQEPEPPCRLNPRVHRDLQTICLRCLDKAPGRRYPSALALAEDLERFLAGGPIAARPAGRLERLGKWARRKPAAAALWGMLFMFGLAAAGYGMWLAQNRAATSRQVETELEQAASLLAQDQLLEARAEARRAQGLLEGTWGHGALKGKLQQILRDLDMIQVLEEITPRPTSTSAPPWLKKVCSMKPLPKVARASTSKTIQLRRTVTWRAP